MGEERIRKQVYDLTEEDLARYPLWEFALDEEGEEGQDEATVRPLPYEYVPANEARLMVGAATARLADGREFVATLYFNCLDGQSVENDRSPAALGSSQPHLLIEGRQFGFWQGSLRPALFRKEMELFYATLGSPAEAIFPIEVTAWSLVEGETSPRQIVVTGFQYRTGSKTVAEVR